MRLTDEMNMEHLMIVGRMGELRDKFYGNPRLDGNFYNRWDKLKSLHLDEIVSYKIKLENFYGDTDAKEMFNLKIVFVRSMF